MDKRLIVLIALTALVCLTVWGLILLRLDTPDVEVGTGASDDLRFAGIANRTIGLAMDWDAENLQRTRQRLAAEDAARFVNRHMSLVRYFERREDLLRFALDAVDQSLNGLYCEFGVYRGESINLIAEHTSSTVHGFDSFEGLPEAWITGHDKGHFAMDGLPEVRENVRLHKGWFDDSLPVWAAEHPGPMAFVHLDADLYSSTKTVLDILRDRLVPGTIIQFDEYFNYPGWQEGEYKAFQEFVAEASIDFEYLGYTAKQVTVRLGPDAESR